MIRLISLLAALLCFSYGIAVGQDPKGLTVDKEKKAVIIDAQIAPRKLMDEKFKGQIYPLEVIATWPYPKGQKAHETVVTFDVKPSEVHKALESLGLKPGKPAFGDVPDPGEGPEVNLFLELPTPDGPKKTPLDRCLVDPKTGKSLPKSVKFRFTGSVMSQLDPTKPDKIYGADHTGTLISIFPVTNQTVLQTNLTMKEEKYLKLEVNNAVLPKEGTPVKLIIEAAAK